MTTETGYLYGCSQCSFASVSRKVVLNHAFQNQCGHREKLIKHSIDLSRSPACHPTTRNSRIRHLMATPSLVYTIFGDRSMIQPWAVVRIASVFLLYLYGKEAPPRFQSYIFFLDNVVEIETCTFQATRLDNPQMKKRTREILAEVLLCAKDACEACIVEVVDMQRPAKAVLRTLTNKWSYFGGLSVLDMVLSTKHKQQIDLLVTGWIDSFLLEYKQNAAQKV